MRRWQVDSITQHVHGQPVLRWQFAVVQEFIRRAAFLGEEHAHEVIIANGEVSRVVIVLTGDATSGRHAGRHSSCW